MSKIINVAKKFLDEMRLSESVVALNVLIESLETKPDPEPSEVYLLETLYQFKEKLKITESKINSYLIQSKQSIPGNKLASLYDDLPDGGYGTSKLFKD